MQETAEKIMRSVLCATMRSFEIGLEAPDERLPLDEFLAESATYLSELFLGEAQINVTDPFNDEIVAGGIISCIVSGGLCRLFKSPHYETERQTFHNIYCYAFRDKPDEERAAWQVIQRLYSKLLSNAIIPQDINERIFQFYTNPSQETLALVARAAEALREAIDQ